MQQIVIVSAPGFGHALVLRKDALRGAIEKVRFNARRTGDRQIQLINKENCCAGLMSQHQCIEVLRAEIPT